MSETEAAAARPRIEGTLPLTGDLSDSPAAIRSLRGRLLETRDVRQRLVEELARQAPSLGARAAVFISVNVPGPDKNLPGLLALVERALGALREVAAGSKVATMSVDALGPYAALLAPGEPTAVKLAAVRIEETLPAGRLLDLDVYGSEGSAVDRHGLGVPSRRCLVCEKPAVECMRLRRHDLRELRAAVDDLIAWAGADGPTYRFAPVPSVAARSKERIPRVQALGADAAGQFVSVPPPVPHPLERALGMRATGAGAGNQFTSVPAPSPHSPKATPDVRKAGADEGGHIAYVTSPVLHALQPIRGVRAAAAFAAPLFRFVPPLDPRLLAQSLVAGAMSELDLTPKPGLVDRHDNGSHPDLTYELMARSVALLPVYFEDLIALRAAGNGLGACIEAGRAAERRMFAAIGTNAHRGFIYLGGLVLLAVCEKPESLGAFRAAIGRLATESYEGRRGRPPAAMSSRVRNDGGDGNSQPAGRGESPPARAEFLEVPDFSPGAGGIEQEAMAGLPSVFDTGLPVFVSQLENRGETDRASHALMARLMQCVDDTTAVRRVGPSGLARLRRDGAELQRAIETGADYRKLLGRWNDEYRALRLTMGGVADLMAVTLAIFFTMYPDHPATRAAIRK